MNGPIASGDAGDGASLTNDERDGALSQAVLLAVLLLAMEKRQKRTSTQQEEDHHLTHVEETTPIALTRVAAVTRWIYRCASTGRKWDQNCAKTKNLTSLPQNISTYIREYYSRGHTSSGSSAMWSICPESGCAIHLPKGTLFSLQAIFLAKA